MKAEEIKLHFQKLNEQRIEMALIDDIKKQQIKVNDTENKALSELKKGISILENSSKIYDLTIKETVSLISEIDKARGMSKQLGVDLPQNIEALANSYGKMIGDYNSYKSSINQFTSKVFS